LSSWSNLGLGLQNATINEDSRRLEKMFERRVAVNSRASNQEV